MIRKPNFKLNWKYALGEVTLIFIGISLAISFDNWNQNQREKEQLEGFLEVIQDNIKADTVDIKRVNRSYRLLNGAAKEHLALAFQDSISEEVLSRSISVLAERYVLIDQSGFEALKSSGLMENLQGTALSDALFAYYSSYQKAYQEELSLNNFIETMEAKLYNTSPDQILDVLKWAFGNNFTDVSAYSKPKKQVLRELAFDPYVLGMIQRMADEDSPRYMVMLENAKTALSQIRNELEN